MSLTEVRRPKARQSQMNTDNRFTTEPERSLPRRPPPHQQDRKSLPMEKMSSLPIDVFMGGELVSLDFSREDHLKDVLEALKDGGVVVLKDAIDSNEQAEKNQYVAAILAAARGGQIQTSEPIRYYKPYSSLFLVPLGRTPYWKELVKKQELVTFTSYHLFGDKKVNWTLQYDIGLREEMTNQTASIKACGKDIIICNNWLARAIPIPDAEFDLIFVMHKV